MDEQTGGDSIRDREPETLYWKEKLHLEKFWEEVYWRRNREKQMVIWVVSLVGVLLSLCYGLEKPPEDPQKLTLMVLLLLVGLGAAYHVVENYWKVNNIAKSIVRINSRLGAWQPYDDEGPLYPEAWKQWGQKTLVEDRITLLFVVCILVMAVLGAIGIWLRN